MRSCVPGTIHFKEGAYGWQQEIQRYVLKGIDPKLAGPFLLRAPVGWINFAFLLFEHTWLFPGSTVGLAKLQIDTAFPPGYWIQVG